MNQPPTEERHVVETLLNVAGIPVPDAEIDKLIEMYRGAAKARSALREPVLGETEPVIVFAPTMEGGNG